MLSCHPTLDMLTDYSSGSLSLAHALAVSTHLDQCAHCREQVKRLNMLGAELLSKQADTAPQSQMSALKSSVLARITAQSEPTSEQATAPAPSSALSDTLRHIPATLRRYIPEGYDKLKWMSLTPSFKLATLSNESSGEQIALLYIKAGAAMPYHTHTGDEITLVLSGAFSDEEGLYRAGDFIRRGDEDHHQPRVTKDADCICLIVLDSPIEFTGRFSRFFNPIMRYFHPSRLAG
ncbi:ChrR family anti-sigma-E factor [Marinomonas ostreistagni]|uniref:ChrR family anti-sigma-E factor n=1 Tax=Marinomonas ostreistagni TaxID=359209 RepID=UPI0019513028|nr:ChrR family anti-sigma-E factor [Marinomonas ostreistagni]MBM6550991.1 cupin domain-containing protein [Marinomonas ostreistagni]